MDLNVDVVDAQLRQCRPCPARQLAPIDKGAEPMGKGMAKRDVLRHGQRRDDVELLVDKAKTGRRGICRRSDCNCLPVLVHGHLIGRDGPGDELDERRLPGAVFAHESVSPTGFRTGHGRWSRNP